MKIQKILITLVSSTFLYSAAVDKLATDLPYELTQFTFEGQKAFAQERGITGLPVVIHFEEAGYKSLRYIAAKHAAGPVPSVTETGHPTFAAIKKAFEEFNPDICIVEGFDSEVETLNWQQICDSSEFKDNPGSESIYTAQLAKGRGIPFIGGEPTNASILTHILQSGLSIDDYAYLSITRQLIQDYRDNKHLWENPDVYLETFVNDMGALYCEQITRKKYTFAEYEDWVKANYNGLFCFEELSDTRAAAPVIDGTRLQQIASVNSKHRDLEILSRIIWATEKYNRVLVVYGGSHYYTQHTELERRFGTPRYENAAF